MQLSAQEIHDLITALTIASMLAPPKSAQRFGDLIDRLEAELPKTNIGADLQ